MKKNNKTEENIFYITTPIYYGNGIPHIGHFYSSTIANVLYKFNKISGVKSRFTTWIDENSQKALQVAKEKNMWIMEYLDEMAGIHQGFWDDLSIDYTDFIRTTEQRHHNVVREVLAKTQQNSVKKWLKKWEKDIYKGSYEWMYCIGCESFKEEDELIEFNGKQVCWDHLKEPDHIKEKNYFFRLERFYWEKTSYNSSRINESRYSVR